MKSFRYPDYGKSEVNWELWTLLDFTIYQQYFFHIFMDIFDFMIYLMDIFDYMIFPNNFCDVVSSCDVHRGWLMGNL